MQDAFLTYVEHKKSGGLASEETKPLHAKDQ